MKSSRAADLLEKSLPLYRILRFGLLLAFVVSAAMGLHGELITEDFDRNFHWFWVAFGGGILLTFIIQWNVEGEARRLRDLGSED